jgi:hypothetical protein
MNKKQEELKALFNQDKLDTIFPPERTNHFFNALLGDPDEGAYDIRLTFNKVEGDQLHFDLELHQRPGKCLACNLTYGLPKVFERHPIINIKDMVNQIDGLMNGHGRCANWKLGRCREITREMYTVPLIIDIENLQDFSNATGG